MGPIILLVTLLYSLFTILVQASFLHPILIWAGVVGNKKPEPKPVEHGLEFNDGKDKVKQEEETKPRAEKQVCGCSPFNALKTAIFKLDNKYISPLFVADFDKSLHTKRLNNNVKDDDSNYVNHNDMSNIHSELQDPAEVDFDIRFHS